MSHSDCDSDGFESAEDDELNDAKARSKQNDGAKVKTNDSNSSKNPSNQTKDETVDKFKALDVNQEEDNDDWGWGDEDDDDDNFNFDSKPTVKETPKEEVTPPPPPQSPKRPDNLGQTVKTTENPQQFTNRPDNQAKSQPDTPSSWSAWSGFSSLLSTASTGVASFTSHVSSVIESNIGIPEPESFAQQQHLEKRNNTTEKKSDSISDSDDSNKQPPNNEETLLNLGSFVSNVTSISNRVIAGGLDTLEGIGKKTMTILQENDAGLISKRKLLGLDNQKPVLSQVLREAKEKSEESEKTMKLTQKKQYRKQLHFETLFDDYHGLVHLEALEMLSKQASLKLQALLMPLSGIALNELQQTMNSVSELCELNELDPEDTPTHLYDVAELEEKLKTASEDFDIPIDFTDILK